MSYLGRIAWRQAKPLWTPANLPGLFMWFSASDVPSITIATGVSQWSDKSGNGRHVTQGTAANQPAWSAAAVTVNGIGIPGVTFDGSNDILTRVAAGLFAAGSATCFLVATAPSIATNRFVVSEGNTADDDSQYAPFKSSTTTASTVHSLVNDDGATANLNNQPATATGWAATPQILTRIDSGSNMKERKNGTGGVNGTNYTRGTVTLNTFALGARARTTPTGYAAVTIHELILCTGVLSADNIQRTESYLATRVAPVALDPTDNGYWSYPP